MDSDMVTPVEKMIIAKLISILAVEANHLKKKWHAFKEIINSDIKMHISKLTEIWKSQCSQY